VDAVRAAVEMQRAMADRNAETVEDKRITFRIWINLGDVIAEEDDIYGVIYATARGASGKFTLARPVTRTS
jgi:class 3 adenylate cyclase